MANIFTLAGGLCLFLFGVKMLSEGVQASAGDRLQKALNFMTGNRFIGVLTGAVVTTMVQSSSATTVMVVSFVNAGLLTLTQSIGVIFGSNIGTTSTAWVVSLIGFSFNIAGLAMPALVLGFLMAAIKWKHRALGAVLMGFSFVFLGLDFMTDSLPDVTPEQMAVIAQLSDRGVLSLIIGVAAGAIVTLLMHSSAATITLVITLAHGKVLGFDMSAAVILGANIGTTIDAILAAIGGKPTAKQTALVHVLFNVIGSVIIMIFFQPFINLVNILVPGGDMQGNIAARLAMFHSMFNITCTVIFLPFVKQIAALASFIIKDKTIKPQSWKYNFVYQSSIYKSPELAIVRAEKEVQDMAVLASSMYTAIRTMIPGLGNKETNTAAIETLLEEMRLKEDYADQMKEQLTVFFMECGKQPLSPRSERNISLLLRIVADIEELTDQCVGVSLLLERSVKKNQVFKTKETEALDPFIALVEEFLQYVQKQLGRINGEPGADKLSGSYAQDLENNIDHNRDKLRKMGRKRIEAGEDVKTELLFIDLVKRIERLGDYCYSISEALSQMNRK
jgi:phosphate:Na+ symporter